MATPRNWLRVLFVVGGSVIILMGVYVALKDTGAAKVTKSGAELLATDGASAAAPKAAPEPPAPKPIIPGSASTLPKHHPARTS